MGSHPGFYTDKLHNILQQDKIMNDIESTLFKMEQIISKSNPPNEYLPKIKQSLITEETEEEVMNDINIT